MKKATDRLDIEDADVEFKRCRSSVLNTKIMEILGKIHYDLFYYSLYETVIAIKDKY